jgi:putative transposase
MLADEGAYLASEATIFRLLARQGMAARRGRAKPPQKRHRPKEQVATAPRQVWSWDITWLRKRFLKGGFFKLYLVLDVFSRKIVGWAVHEQESAELAAELMEEACRKEGIPREHVLVLHADNGKPMKGSTLLAKLDELGITTSFSRPRVSDDNPYSEALFGTLKGCPRFPTDGFCDLEHACQWVSVFVMWYNEQHLHSGIRYVTPAQRHRGEDRPVLARRVQVYEAAKKRNPLRWSRGTRNWTHVEEVRLNPEPEATSA